MSVDKKTKPVVAGNVKSKVLGTKVKPVLFKTISDRKRKIPARKPYKPGGYY